jgi:hypothetical protein
MTALDTYLIRSITVANADTNSRLVLWLEGRPKGVIPHLKLLRRLMSAYGDDTDNWIGQPVTIGPAVEWHGEDDDGLSL